MIGRLVEQQQVGLAEQQLGQRQAHLPAAGECFGLPVEIRRGEPEPVQHGGGLQIDAVPVVEPEAILQVAVAGQHRLVLAFGNRRVAQPLLERVHLGFHREQRAERAGGFLEDGPAGVGQAVLRQIADRQRRRLEDGAAVRLVEPGHHAQQRGLAGAVRAAQAHPLARSDLPGDVVEQDAVAESFREGGELNHSPRALAAAASTCGTRNGLVR